MNKCPCKNCTDRWVNETNSCHSSCSKYIQFKKELNAYNKKEKENRYIDQSSYDENIRRHK